MPAYRNIYHLLSLATLFSLSVLVPAHAGADTNEPSKKAAVDTDIENIRLQAGKKNARDEYEIDLDSVLASDNRIKLLRYDKNDIYTLPTRVGYQSNIEFSENEEIMTLSVGDRSFWQIIPTGNRLFIRPHTDGVSTNMTIITNKYTYQFDLKSVESEDDSIIYVARFIYPEKKKKMDNETDIPIDAYGIPLINQAPVTPGRSTPPPTGPRFYSTPQQQPTTPSYTNAKQATTPTHTQAIIAPAYDTSPRRTRATPEQTTAMLNSMPESPPVKSKQHNYFYTFAGPDQAAPYEVFDDGRSTYFRFAQPTAMPPRISKIGNTGTEMALTPYAAGEYYAVDAVAPELVLYMPQGTVYLFNETFSMHP